jgi:hypothetical protein
MKKRVAIIGLIALTFALAAAAAFASDPVKLYVNGQEMELNVLPQIVNGRVMVPVRWIAEALDAEVKWDKKTNSVLINKNYPAFISKEEVITLIEEQGKASDYYIEGLSYELVNLDNDADLEIAAKIDGAVHLGHFFIFKQDLLGKYKLITEQSWKVERCNFRNPLEIEGKKLFEVVTRTGGTGLDIFDVHLVYLEDGTFVEAWQGTLFERSAALPGAYYRRIGSYQVDREANYLYAWETTHQLEQDGVTPKGEGKTTTNCYLFDGSFFNETDKTLRK